jgi:diaminopimelate decarboxylase
MQVDVVGPVCESSDFLAKSIQITSVESGDWLAVADSGAYGFSMATPYNAFDFPLEIVL